MAASLQPNLSPAQEAVAVVLHKTLLVPLDDLLAVVWEFLNPEVSRSGFERCLRRHGVGNLRDLLADIAPVQAAAPMGFGSSMSDVLINRPSANAQSSRPKRPACQA